MLKDTWYFFLEFFFFQVTHHTAMWNIFAIRLKESFEILCMICGAGTLWFKTNMSAPLFPKLIPSAYDKLWFNVDKPCDDENELLEQEEEYQTMVFYLFLSLWI